MKFDGEHCDVPVLLTAACVGDRRLVNSLVMWKRVSKRYRRAVAQALDEWCANEYADAQRAYVDAVLATGASPAPSPLTLPRARAALVALCEKAFGSFVVGTFGQTVTLCGKMDAETYMCVQTETCRLCGKSMFPSSPRLRGNNTASTHATPSRCQIIEAAFRQRMVDRPSDSFAENSSTALSFTFGHMRCQMAHCRPFWSSAAYGQFNVPDYSREPIELVDDSVWKAVLPTLVGDALRVTSMEVEDANINVESNFYLERERCTQAAYRAFALEKPHKVKILPPQLNRRAHASVCLGRASDEDEEMYAKATRRVQAVLRTDAYGQVHSEANALQLQDCCMSFAGHGQQEIGDLYQRLRVCAASRRLHMAWVLPHPAVRSEDTLMGCCAGDAMVFSNLTSCLSTRLERAEAAVVRWEQQIADNTDCLVTLQTELGKLPGMPSDALAFLECVHPSALQSLGVQRFMSTKTQLPTAEKVLNDLRWLFIPSEWETHVLLDEDRAVFVANHAEKVRQLLRRARVTTLKTLHDCDIFRPSHPVELVHDSEAWINAFWVLLGKEDVRARSIATRQFLAGVGIGFATSDAQHASHRQACRAALDWLFDTRGGLCQLVEYEDASAQLGHARNSGANVMPRTDAGTPNPPPLATAATAATFDRSTMACLMGKLLASLHHTCCSMRVHCVQDFPRARAAGVRAERVALVQFTWKPRLCRSTVPMARVSKSTSIALTELENELSFALQEAEGREGSQWRELESAAAALFAFLPELYTSSTAVGENVIQGAIDALLRVGLEDAAPRRVRTSALRITRVGSALIASADLAAVRILARMPEEQQRACPHFPNACACRPVPAME